MQFIRLQFNYINNYLFLDRKERNNISQNLFQRKKIKHTRLVKNDEMMNIKKKNYIVIFSSVLSNDDGPKKLLRKSIKSFASGPEDKTRVLERIKIREKHKRAPTKTIRLN